MWTTTVATPTGFQYRHIKGRPELQSRGNNSRHAGTFLGTRAVPSLVWKGTRGYQDIFRYQDGTSASIKRYQWIPSISWVKWCRGGGGYQWFYYGNVVITNKLGCRRKILDSMWRDWPDILGSNNRHKNSFLCYFFRNQFIPLGRAQGP